MWARKPNKHNGNGLTSSEEQQGHPCPRDESECLSTWGFAGVFQAISLARRIILMRLRVLSFEAGQIEIECRNSCVQWGKPSFEQIGVYL